MEMMLVLMRTSFSRMTKKLRKLATARKKRRKKVVTLRVQQRCKWIQIYLLIKMRRELTKMSTLTDALVIRRAKNLPFQPHPLLI